MHRKPRLRLVITSATLDGEKFSTYFRDCPVFSIPGRCYEVAVVHAAQVPPRFQWDGCDGRCMHEFAADAPWVRNDAGHGVHLRKLLSC